MSTIEAGVDGVGVCDRVGAMRWVVVHYHWRPGGVRRVIEAALPAMMACGLEAENEVVLVAGEEPRQDFWAALKVAVGARLRREVIPSLGYFELADEGAAAIWAAEALAGARRVLGDRSGGDTVVWLHNPAVGRNAGVAAAWAHACGETGARLIRHQHDFFSDWRWHHWPAIRAFGCGTVESALAAMIPEGPQVRHVAINSRDAAWLAARVPGRVAWVPNPIDRSAGRLEGEGRRGSGAYWLAPTRTLRRKNLAEAILLARAFGPRGGLVIAGGASSALESAYSERLRHAVRAGRWKVRWGGRNGVSAEAMQRLWQLSEAAVVTSLQEGFSLPVLEAAALGVPLVARTTGLPWRDFQQGGISADFGYGDIWIPDGWFDGSAERRRQERLFAAWSAAMPEGAVETVRAPQMAAGGEPSAFAVLSLTAQLEVLARSDQEIRDGLLSANSHLGALADGSLSHPARMDDHVLDAFSARRFSERFMELLDRWDEPWPAPSTECNASHKRPFHPLLAAPDGG